MNRAKGNIVCAIMLLFSILVLNVAECQKSPSEPTGFFTVLGTPEATVPFGVNLTVQIDPSIYAGVYGYFSVRDPTESILVYGNITWAIDFDTSIQKNYTFPGIVISSSGSYVLWTDVHWRYKTGDVTWKTTVVRKQIDVAPSPVPGYSVVWLQRPNEGAQIRAGKLIRFKFSIRNETSGSFVLSDDVRIEVRNATGSLIVEATCGRRSDSIRININGEYYRWYWKTDSDLLEGAYSVTVLLDGVELSPPILIMIVSKI